MLKISKIYILLSFLILSYSLVFCMERHQRRQGPNNATNQEELLKRLGIFLGQDDERLEELRDALRQNGPLRERVFSVLIDEDDSKK
jgi:hypothetical protein